jgi:hypothetical protein
MRLKDYANNYLIRIDDYQIFKLPWEKQVAIFYKGRCIQTVKRKNQALAFVKGNS